MSTLALSMIVRDAAGILPACLESARGTVDEMVIADTGSADNTRDVARRLGARVISIPWTNNFAEARNRALLEVKSDWVLTLDADEQLDTRARKQIRPLLEQQAISGFVVTIRNYVLSLEERVWDCAAKPNDSLLPAASAYPAFVEHENVRLFRRDQDIYFVGRVHESVGPRIQELGQKLAPAPFFIHHFGLAADPETRARKNYFYRELGREKIREMPQNAQAHMELGLVELDNFRNFPEALELFRRSCELNPRLSVAWFFQGLTLVKLERFSAALECLAESEKRGHRTSLVAETRGDAEYNLKEYRHACESYTLALRRDSGNVLLESKLGLTMVRAGKTSQGLKRIQRAVASRPAAGESHDRLILALVWLDRIAEAAAEAEEKIEAVANCQPGDFLRTASLWARARKFDRAAEALQAGLRRYPGHETLVRSLGEVAPRLRTQELASSLDLGTSGG